MSAHPFDIGPETRDRIDTLQAAHFRGIEVPRNTPGSIGTRAVTDGKASPFRFTRGGATHTDPQILFGFRCVDRDVPAYAWRAP
jgi:hypothetical protein